MAGSDTGVPVPVGQKMLMVDGEDFPFLEIRKLEFAVRVLMPGAAARRSAQADRGRQSGGESLRYEPVYDKIKEARREDDDAPQGEWQRERKTADWDFVIKLAGDSLASKAKTCNWPPG